MTLGLYSFMFLAALSALGIVAIRNVFYGALLLLLCLISLAGIYFMVQAEFLAVTQIIIYAGGVSVLILFGIMLTSQLSGKKTNVANGNFAGGLLVATVLLLVLGYSINSQPMAPDIALDVAAADITIGLPLFTTFVAPFEVAGVLLLISLIAAAVIASQTQAARKK